VPQALKRLGVLGWPVAHSRSPAMHMAAFAALSMPGWHYQRLPVPPELFAETVRALPGAGFVGANVTIPHKQAALAIADETSEAAAEIGAANTLLLGEDGGVRAENTDAGGLVAALEQSLSGAGSAPSTLKGLQVMLLGAGGSARAAIWGLLRAGVGELFLWNRTESRAQALVQELGGSAVANPVAADVLVNCTAVGLGQTATGEASKVPSDLEQSSSEADALNQLALKIDQLREYSYVVDLVYRTGGTPLLNAARRLGAQTLDGVEILVQQGALSFELWTGVQPPLDAMREAARAD
jgi:shikimate dehydrogenase